MYSFLTVPTVRFPESRLDEILSVSSVHEMEAVE